MWSALRRFFSTDGFMPHGHCYLWTPGILWTNVVSDLLIGIAYTSIPLSLWFLLRRRRDVPFNSIIFLFGVFIISCGFTHFMEVWTTWHPAYGAQGAVKAVTAGASVLTALQLVRFLPAAIALPNITQYRSMYELAKESQASYRAILEASLDGFYVLEPVPGEPVGFRVTDLNAEAVKQLRMPREQAIGAWVQGSPLLEPILPLLREVARTRQPVRHEYSVASLHFVVHVAPFRGDGVAVKLRDVTEQREAARRVEESERRYRQVVSRAPITFFALDERGNYLLADGRAYQRLGLDPRTLPGRSSFDVFRDSPGVRALLERALSGEEATGVVEVGSIILKSQVTPVRGLDGRVEGATGVSVDVTEQVQAERALRALTETLDRRVRERTSELEVANEELASFASSVAHDLRSPLRAMDGFADAVARDADTRLSTASERFLSRIRAGARRMSQLIDDLLELSRVTRVELLRQEVDLSTIALGVATELRVRTPGREVEVVIAEGLRAEGDPYLLRVVLENLLENAWKFTSRAEKSRVELSAMDHLGRRTFVVRDNGVGFDMAYAGQLFAPFQRLHARDEFEGTGIGLATVKRIVTRHGGEVWAEAEVGKGASFYFTLE